MVLLIRTNRGLVTRTSLYGAAGDYLRPLFAAECVLQISEHCGLAAAVHQVLQVQGTLFDVDTDTGHIPRCRARPLAWTRISLSALFGNCALSTSRSERRTSHAPSYLSTAAAPGQNGVWVQSYLHHLRHFQSKTTSDRTKSKTLLCSSAGAVLQQRCIRMSDHNGDDYGSKATTIYTVAC